MKFLTTIILLFAVGTVFAGPNDLNRSSTFDSPEAFQDLLKNFGPSRGKSDLKPLFTIQEDIYPPATAESLSSSEAIWENNNYAIIFATAQPPTADTKWIIGLLFLLQKKDSHWKIVDSLRFNSTNREAKITCNVTSGERITPILTIVENQGRRDFGYQLSASYSFENEKFKRVDLE